MHEAESSGGEVVITVLFLLGLFLEDEDISNLQFAEMAAQIAAFPVLTTTTSSAWAAI